MEAVAFGLLWLSWRYIIGPLIESFAEWGNDMLGLKK